jgi:hypothetical protein
MTAESHEMYDEQNQYALPFEGLPAHFWELTEARSQFLSDIQAAAEQHQPALISFGTDSYLGLPSTFETWLSLRGAFVPTTPEDTTPRFIDLTTIASLDDDGAVQAGRVYAGEQAIGTFLQIDPVLGGETTGGLLEDFIVTVWKMHALAKAQLDLSDCGFASEQIERITDLWVSTLLFEHPYSGHFDLPLLLAALRATDRRQFEITVQDVLTTLRTQLFEIIALAPDTRAIIRYRERLYGLHQALRGPLDRAGRVRTIRDAAVIALASEVE